MAVMRGGRVRGTQAAFVVVAHRPERGAAGGLARLAAWREVADAWADAGVRRGDVVHLESESGSLTRVSFSLLLRA